MLQEVDLTHSTAVVMGRLPLVDEMGSGDLGDARLNARRDRVLTVLEQRPDAGFPAACGDEAATEGLYRFLRNPRVTWAGLLAPHVRATAARCAAVGDVLVLHDTTDMVFPGEGARAGLVPLSRRRRGFWMHASLAVSADGLRAPLGLLAVQPYVRRLRGTDTPRPTKASRWADPLKESRCWAEGVRAVRGLLPAPQRPIHVMDRAADSYEWVAEWLAQGDRFVVRLTHDRQVAAPDGVGPLSTVVPRTPLGERTVTLSPRAHADRPRKTQRTHPARAGRVARLQFAAHRVVLQRPRSCAATVPATLAVHVVTVWEVDPPAGEAPVEWRLITSEPIDTGPAVLQIIDHYRTRWMIEEYFKALKTGCAYEQRQLESLRTLLIALALLAPVAWQLLLLRHLAQTAPAGPAEAVLTSQQLDVLRASPARRHLTSGLTIAAICRAVAALGGHLSQNGPPGWLVLSRGMEKLRLMESGWVAAQARRLERSDQS